MNTKSTRRICQKMCAFLKNLNCMNNSTNHLWFFGLFDDKKSFRTTKQTYLPEQFCFSVLCLEFDQYKPCFRFETPFQTTVQSSTFRAQCFNLWNESSRDFEDDFPMFCRLLHIFSFFFLVSQLIQVSAKVMRFRNDTFCYLPFYSKDVTKSGILRNY